MERMKNIQYATIMVLPCNSEMAFSYINKVAGWWPEMVAGETAKLNDEFTFRTGDMHYSKQRIVEWVPNKKVVWLVVESLRKTDNFEWTGTRMIFELEELDGNSLLHFTYDGPVLEQEFERLEQICDMVIKEKLYHFIKEAKATEGI